MDINFVFFLLKGYLIGSIPFGLILTKLFLKQDIRQVGSGNIGTTNVLRTGNKSLAATTLILDALKGAIPIFILVNGLYDNSDMAGLSIAIALLLGIATIIGHCFPVWLKFKGGKGVATTFGVLFAAVPYAGLAAAITWLSVAFTTKYSSFSALSAIAVATIVTFITYGVETGGICFLITLLVWIRHKDNIMRLLNGTETKIGAKGKSVGGTDSK